MTKRTSLVWLAGVVGAACAALLSMQWIASRRPAATPVLTLRVNAASRADIATGAPVIFHVGLAGGRDGRGVTIGEGSHPWATLVSFVRAESHDELPWRVDSLGRASSTRIGRKADGSLDIQSEQASGASVDGHHLHHARFGVSPETMVSARPGTYRIQAILERGYWPPWRWHGRVESAAVTVVVRSPADAKDRERLEQERLILSAQYDLARRRWDAAHQAALQLVTRAPKDPALRMLLGDTLAAQGNFRDALGAYRTALKLSPRRYEQPQLLYERIRNASRKLVK